MQETHILLTGILAITHPKLYQSAIVMRDRMRADPGVAEYIDRWGMPFSAVSLIANRQTPIHRDEKSLYTAADILLNTGHHTFTSMSLGSLGLRISYQPGTVIVLAGRLVAHGVTQFTGDRLCNAYYFREILYRRLRIRDPGFMTQQAYIDCHGTWGTSYLPTCTADYLPHI